MLRYQVLVLLSLIYAAGCQTTTTTTATTTPATSMSTTAYPLAPMNADRCGIDFGCFRVPSTCSGTNCTMLITYKEYMTNYIDVTMETTKNWVALGLNTARQMIETYGVVCYKNGSNLVVDSMRLPDKMKMGLNGGLVNGTRSMGILYKDNRIICKYRRTFTVPAESEQYMRSLEAPKFAVWGNSEALTGNGEPGQHMGPGSNERFAEEMQTDLRFVAPTTTDTTSTTTMSTTTASPLAPMNADRCGIDFGCFRVPNTCTGTNCIMLITYKEYMTNYIDVTMETTKNWVALGLNTARQMIGTYGVVCYKNGSNLVVDSMRLPDKMKMGLNGGLVNGTRSMGILYKDNRIICKYRRTFTVPAESEQYMRSLEAPKFAVWGNSEALTGNGEPGQHMGPGSNERFAEEMQTDLRFVASTPGPTTTPATGTVSSPQKLFLIVTAMICVLVQVYQ